MSDFRSSAPYKAAKQIIRFGLPIILLTIIFTRIDLGKLADNFREISFIYLLGALVLVALSQLLIGALRWKITLRGLYGIEAPYLSLLRYMWIGLFLGYFVPGGVGIDIYRTYRIARHGGGYGRNIAAIIGEKIYTAIGSVLLVLVCYMVLHGKITAAPEVVRIIRICFYAGSAAVILGIAAVFAAGTERGRFLLSFIHHRIESAIKKVLSKISGKDRDSMEDEDYTTKLIKPLFNWRIALLAGGITVVMRIVTGTGINVLYRALGVELPIIVNIFVNALLFYLFVLPISFGSLGVREGGNILLYGLFGIEAETALTVSFLSLACVMLAISIGGIILLVDNITAGRSRADRSLP